MRGERRVRTIEVHEHMITTRGPPGHRWVRTVASGGEWATHASDDDAPLYVLSHVPSGLCAGTGSKPWARRALAALAEVTIPGLEWADSRPLGEHEPEIRAILLHVKAILATHGPVRS